MVRANVRGKRSGRRASDGVRRLSEGVRRPYGEKSSTRGASQLHWVGVLGSFAAQPKTNKQVYMFFYVLVFSFIGASDCGKAPGIKYCGTCSSSPSRVMPARSARPSRSTMSGEPSFVQPLTPACSQPASQPYAYRQRADRAD